MRKLLTLSFLGAAVAATSAFGASIVTYTDSTAFNNSAIVGGATTVTENFNTNASLFTTFDIAGSVGTVPGFSGGQRTTRVTSTYSELVTLNAGNMVAFGGTWDLSPFSGLGAGVRITVALAGGGTQVVTPVLGWNVGNGNTPFFFGFTSDTAITSVTLSQGGQGGLSSEGFNLDNLIVSQSGTAPPPPPSGVPEPSTFGLMGIAMVGLGLVRRSRR